MASGSRNRCKPKKKDKPAPNTSITNAESKVHEKRAFPNPKGCFLFARLLEMRRPTNKSPDATRSDPPSSASAKRTTLPVMIIAVTLRAMSPRSTRKEVRIVRLEEILDMTSLYGRSESRAYSADAVREAQFIASTSESGPWGAPTPRPGREPCGERQLKTQNNHSPVPRLTRPQLHRESETRTNEMAR